MIQIDPKKIQEAVSKMNLPIDMKKLEESFKKLKDLPKDSVAKKKLINDEKKTG